MQQLALHRRVLHLSSQAIKIKYISLSLSQTEKKLCISAPTSCCVVSFFTKRSSSPFEKEKNWFFSYFLAGMCPSFSFFSSSASLFYWLFFTQYLSRAVDANDDDSHAFGLCFAWLANTISSGGYSEKDIERYFLFFFLLSTYYWWCLKCSSFSHCRLLQWTRGNSSYFCLFENQLDDRQSIIYWTQTTFLAATWN